MGKPRMDGCASTAIWTAFPKLVAKLDVDPLRSAANAIWTGSPRVTTTWAASFAFAGTAIVSASAAAARAKIETFRGIQALFGPALVGIWQPYCCGAL